jgi:hypothetical protein
MMIDTDDIARQVRMNCDISDAQHAGLYSICGLALRLRDLYKWEHRLPPWIEKDSTEILEWIDARENKWEELADNVYISLRIDGCTYDAFDSRGVNTILEPFSLYYSAGYALSLKPTFLLAHIENKAQVDEHTVYFLGQELARDLLTIPAMSQDGGIILRRDAARLYLWDKISYINKSGRPALRYGLRHCGLDNPSTNELQRHFDEILSVQSRTYIHHEIGELEDTTFCRDIWREIIAAYPHTPVELSARAVKDLLADTSPKGSLQDIIGRKDAAALGFYVAFFDGLGKAFFPELGVAFQLFINSGDWRVIGEAAEVGRQTARQHAETMTTVFKEGQNRQDPQWAAKEIENRLLCGIIKQ